MKKTIIGVLVFSLLTGYLFWRFSPALFNKARNVNQDVTLTYWGLVEDESVLRPAIDAFQKSHPNIKVNYIKQSPLNYQTRLQTQIRAGQGPDIFDLHNSWLTTLIFDMAPSPPEIISLNEYSQTFYPVAKETLTASGKVLAVPSEVDGLAMYVNEDILKAANVEVPKTWPEFIEAARKVTVKNQEGQIQTAGAALGTTANVEFWPEIVGLLFLQQPQGNLVSPANKDGSDVLQFYTGFVTDPRNKTWDVTMPINTRMFTEGKLAFYFGNSRKAAEIKQANPDLSYKIVPMPQLPGKEVAWASFWAKGVSKSTLHPHQAWEFLKYLSSPQALQLIYQQQTYVSPLGRPFPRVDMGNLLSDDPILGSFVIQGPIYKSWYLNTTGMEGDINSEIVKAYQGAVDATLAGQNPLGALQATAGEVQRIMDKYSKPVPIQTK